LGDRNRLHPLGLNAFVLETGGVRLTAARTLATDSRYRQLNVRRLLILLKRVLLRQLQWAVFEPNGPPLWRQVKRMLDAYLLRLYSDGAFRGETAEQAFFVRCDASTNPRPIVDAGKLVAIIGVAPAEPMEFILVRITLDGDSPGISEVTDG
jgi:phage tail sheath protein FI